MKAIFFEAMEGKAPVLVDIPEEGNSWNFAWMKEKLGYDCRCLDSTLRCVAGKTYRFFVDDEGAFNTRQITAHGSNDCVLFGNMFIFGKEDARGELTEVTEADLEHIKNHVSPFFNITMLFELSFPKTTFSLEALALMAAQGVKHEKE